jgi:PUA domain protein
MKKKTLSKKEIRTINEEISKYGFQFDKKDFVEIVEDEKHKVLKKDNDVVFFYISDEIFPSLKIILGKKVELKLITVDMGAVKFVVNGADIMRPGIVDIQEGINNDEIVIIQDVDNKKPLAIGKALFDSDEMKSQQAGKVIKNLHWIGDEIWNFSH